MPSFWNKAAQIAADLYAGNDSADHGIVRANFATEPKPRPSIRRDPAPLAKPLTPTNDELRVRLAEELDYARRMLTLMGDELASDRPFVSRHLAELQTIDIVSQMLGHIAAVIGSSDPPSAVERIGMGALKARLMRKGRL